ncbi:hypothetical protein JRQ81_013294 [Phrynocephalus forsythii]|uniref:Uncharacterized protein n=1 Tax=Phrynocephalus forsythii TaxID=171643 RepID=A0A9Q0Y242_9SAUR|nr:hypothetical protein JRQ81_013294 [Phrynocephalus forsythii]
MGEKRQEYFFLTKVLIAREFPFKWLTPEGVLLNWEARRFNLNSKMKARNFLEEMRHKLKLTEEDLQFSSEESRGEYTQPSPHSEMADFGKQMIDVTHARCSDLQDRCLI